jgi:hypothetical protein
MFRCAIRLQKNYKGGAIVAPVFTVIRLASIEHPIFGALVGRVRVKLAGGLVGAGRAWI